MRVCTSGADEDGLDVRVVGQVVCESFTHWFRVAREVQVVFGGGGLDEGVDFFEGVFREDEDGVQFGGELGVVGEVVDGVVGGGGEVAVVGVQGGEVED